MHFAQYEMDTVYALNQWVSIVIVIVVRDVKSFFFGKDMGQMEEEGGRELTGHDFLTFGLSQGYMLKWSKNFNVIKICAISQMCGVCTLKNR